MHNLHGMPGVVGGVASILAVVHGQLQPSLYGTQFDTFFSMGSNQAAFQAAALGVSVGMAIAGGLLTGLIVRAVTGVLQEHEMFTDSPFWEMPGDFDDSPVHPSGKIATSPVSVQRLGSTVASPDVEGGGVVVQRAAASSGDRLPRRGSAWDD